MASNSNEICRICCQPGHYNMFNVELCVEASKVAIFKILNHFLYDKLYAPDEHSSLICRGCCTSLSDSFVFMKKVRSAEQGLKLGTHKRESYCKTTSSSVASIEDQVPAVLEESISDETLQENMCYEEVEIEDEMYEPEDTQEVEDVKPAIEPSPKKSKPRLPSQGGFPDSITYTHFELEHSNENDQNIITLNIRLQTIDRPKDGTFQFELSWIKHFDAAAIYQCRYCVKAFANAEYLLKHTVSSHICLICSRILDNYSKKEAHHSLQHASIKCPFCYKSCGPSSFRQHLKKVHGLQLPSHIGVVANE